MRRRYLEVSRASTALLVRLQHLHVLVYAGLILVRQRGRSVLRLGVLSSCKRNRVRFGKISAHLMKIRLACVLVDS